MLARQNSSFLTSPSQFQSRQIITPLLGQNTKNWKILCTKPELSSTYQATNIPCQQPHRIPMHQSNDNVKFEPIATHHTRSTSSPNSQAHTKKRTDGRWPAHDTRHRTIISSSLYSAHLIRATVRRVQTRHHPEPQLIRWIDDEWRSMAHVDGGLRTVWGCAEFLVETLVSATGVPSFFFWSYPKIYPKSAAFACLRF